MPGKNRLLQRASVHEGEWTHDRRESFLDALARSCNVRKSAAAVNMSQVGAYALRRRDAGFAEAWRAAMQAGYERLEGELLAQAIAAAEAGAFALQGQVTVTGGPGGDRDADRDEDGENAARAMTAEEIRLSIFLLTRHEAAVRGGKGAVRYGRRATREETNAKLKAKLDLIDRQRQAVQ